MTFLKNTLLSGVPFGLALGAFFYFLYGRHPSGLIGGVVAGLLFGLSMAAFQAYQRKRSQAERPSLPGEEILHEGPANHFMAGESAGGWMFLTSRRLYFRSHRVNFQPHELSLPLTEISSAMPSLTAGFIPNGLLVSTTSGATERFVVEGRKQWSKAIAAAKARNV